MAAETTEPSLRTAQPGLCRFALSADVGALLPGVSRVEQLRASNFFGLVQPGVAAWIALYLTPWPRTMLHRLQI